MVRFDAWGGALTLEEERQRTRRLPEPQLGTPDVAPVRTDLAVILAAGEGLRFGWDDGPKPLVRVLGLTLAERVVEACLAVGVKRFVFVLGYRSKEVRAYLEPAMRKRGCTTEFVVVENWERGNGASALTAAPVVQDRRFLLLMCDHLVSEALLSSVLEVDPGQGGVCLAVDHTRPPVFDSDDATRAVVADGRVLRLGKRMERWDGTDTGVFHCSQGLFDGLRRAADHGGYSLTDGMNELGVGGHLAAVDVTGEWWLDVDAPHLLRDARRLLLMELAKPQEDGFVARYLNRPLSTRISARLSATSVTPNQVTVLAFGIAVAGAMLFALGGLVGNVSGAMLVQLASVVDGSDGELARLTHTESPRGGWLDTVLDRYADLAIVAGVGFGAGHTDPLVWGGALMAATGFILASYVTKEFLLRHGWPYPADVPARLKKRDLRLFAIFVGGLAGHPFAAVVAVGVLSHICVLVILARGWRLAAPAS